MYLQSSRRGQTKTTNMELEMFNMKKHLVVSKLYSTAGLGIQTPVQVHCLMTSIFRNVTATKIYSNLRRITSTMT
ncbi:hypothetical protein G9C98_006156 [Cotesia typhae]|uniref:Uncharacterized protein n=1 Tax=Cotesia typhae TaxID=2053667 RepID=A0A8J5UV28_9HYME|nr:hypothetical protein G9C98_006156 [Cotesia typhae]